MSSDKWIIDEFYRAQTRATSPALARPVITKGFLASTSTCEKNDGTYLRRNDVKSKPKPVHICELPRDEPFPGDVWMCLTCRQVYVGKVYTVGNFWALMYPWNQWRWRHKWKKQHGQ